MLTKAYCLIYMLLFLTVAIKKRSRVPGVIITQYVEQLPLGKSTPDFTRKPVAITVQEGKTQTHTIKPNKTITLSLNLNDCFVIHIGCISNFQVKRLILKLW